MITWNYIAGFFDGEGSITHNGKGYRVTISQTHQGVFDQIAKFTGVGSYFKIKKRKEHWKEAWVYYVAKQEDVLFFLKKMAPYLIIKSVLAKKTILKLLKIVALQKDRRLKRSNNITEAKALRSIGLSFRAIGERLKIDFGHARRLTRVK